MFTDTRLTPRDFGTCESLINERRWFASVLYLFCSEVKRILKDSLIKESLTNVEQASGLHERDAEVYKYVSCDKVRFIRT